MTDRAGFTVLEVLAALAIVSVTGAAAVGVTSATVRAVAVAELREREMEIADRLLSAHSLLNAPDLDRRLGTRELGDYIVRVERPYPRLYRVSVMLAASPARDLLATVLYRPEPDVP